MIATNSKPGTPSAEGDSLGRLELVMVSARLGVEWLPLASLFCSPSNPRHNDEAVPHVAASLRRFGWQQPIVAKPSRGRSSPATRV